jgi:uncharacterized protein with PQ loop repeat
VHHTIKHTAHKKHKSKHGDALVYFFAFATPLFMIPQALEIFKNQSADNISLTTWVFFILADFVWIAYAIRHRLRPILYGHLLYLGIEAPIVTGILMYPGN